MNVDFVYEQCLNGRTTPGDKGTGVVTEWGYAIRINAKGTMKIAA